MEYLESIEDLLVVPLFLVIIVGEQWSSLPGELAISGECAQIALMGIMLRIYNAELANSC